MRSFEIVLANVLGIHLQAKNYSKIWEVIIKDRSVLSALVNTGTETEIIEFLNFCGRENVDEISVDDLDYICRELLSLAYGKRWYKLCGFIYGIGYYSSADPLCGSRHPLLYAASQHNYAFAEAYVEGQKHFGCLTFDGECRDLDGVFRTILEQLVLIDDVDIMELCLVNGANPNAFGFSGDCLLNFAHSDRMSLLLERYNAKNCTEQERNLVKAVNELRHERLRRKTINKFFSTEPLLKLNWYHGTTMNSREQQYDIFLEAALLCHSELLAELYPYAQKDLDDAQKRIALRAILGQHYTLPCGRILDERPVDIARSLEVLRSVGFRYGASHKADTEHPILEMINSACLTFSLREAVSFDIQLRAFTALWEIGGSPNGECILNALTQLAEEYPLTALEIFVYYVENADEKE